MCQQFRLGLTGLGEPLRQYLRNALMVLLARTLEERLIGGFLDEGMLKNVPITRWQTTLVDQLSVY